MLVYTNEHRGSSPGAGGWRSWFLSWCGIALALSVFLVGITRSLQGVFSGGWSHEAYGADARHTLALGEPNTAHPFEYGKAGRGINKYPQIFI